MGRNLWLVLLGLAVLLSSVYSHDDDDHHHGWGDDDDDHRKPNFVIFLADDLGYGDLSTNGAPDISTPNIDKLASNGKKLTSFYSTPMCTPTRSAILTGRDPIRNGMYNAQTTLNIGSQFQTPPPVLYPRSYGMLPESEILISQLLKEVGYTTGLFGKWHLGTINDTALPLQRGYDRYWGMPYSSDMGCPPGIGYPCLNTAGPASTWVPVPLYDNNDIIEQPTTFENFTPRLTSQVIDFIIGAKHQRKPFFVNVNWVTPHLPLFTAPEYVGSSTRGAYGDTVQEIDGSVGLILDTLKKLHLDDDTLVIFLSDNGPSIFFQAGGGSAGPFFGGKGQSYEGGVRVPSIWSWPGRIEPNTQDHSITSVTDIFTTVATVAGATVPTDRVIDGRDLSPVLFENQPSGRECIAYYVQSQLTAVRCGAYKLHYMIMPSMVAVPVPLASPILFNINSDPGEKWQLNTTLFANVVTKINTFKDQWLASVVPGPAQFGTYNTTVGAYQPCCNIATNCYCPPASTVQPTFQQVQQTQQFAEMVTSAFQEAGIPAFGPTTYFFD